MNKETKYRVGMILIMIVVSILFVNIVNAAPKEKEKIHKFQIISSDLVDREVPEIQINEYGEAVIWMSINATYCGMDSSDKTKTYYLSPEDSSTKLNFSSSIVIMDDCEPRNYFETAKFVLLGTNFSSGIYDFYRDYEGYPLYMNKVHIKGNLPNAVVAGSSEEINMTLLNRLIYSAIEVLDYIKQYFEKEYLQPQLSVIASKWTRYGENWVVEANYTDQKGRPILGNCKLNTDYWDVTDMNYNAEKKLYVAEHLAEPVGKMRWTVVCY